MGGLNAEQVRMLLEVEAGTFKSAGTAVMSKNLSAGLVFRPAGGSPDINITSRGKRALRELRAGEISGTCELEAVPYNYTAVWRTEYPYVNWGAVLKRGHRVKAAPGGSFVCRDLSQVPSAVRDLAEASIRDLVGAENRRAEIVTSGALRA